MAPGRCIAGALMRCFHDQGFARVRARVAKAEKVILAEGLILDLTKRDQVLILEGKRRHTGNAW